MKAQTGQVLQVLSPYSIPHSTNICSYCLETTKASNECSARLSIYYDTVNGDDIQVNRQGVKTKEQYKVITGNMTTFIRQ